MSTNINYIWKDYMDLSIDELYAIINLRKLIIENKITLSA